ncbi:aspartate--tRNA ligase [Candidatus Gracilibacteria bacterium]|nr:aspartate--tRNA ligase [Candidatus Gracilibacteria bacterium]
MYRTHTCSELNKSHIGQEVILSGWVANRRDHGGIIFIDLRDRYGITQVVFDPQDNEDTWKLADSFRSEYVVKLTGKVRSRPDGQQNEKLQTGEIEVLIFKAEILTKSKTPPFEISDFCDAGEEIRFKYRFLDLRRSKIFKNIEFRNKLNLFTRNWFNEKGFIEVQTPIFTVSSPEGARDYLIPSRINPGKFYALPQAPQQYKQLLMVGGIDKYFQIAPCFRDEDPRADRHSCEFYQIDCEMSFVEQEDIFMIVESFFKDVAINLSPDKKMKFEKFERLTHKEAIDKYGSDKPDLRFDMHFEDFSTNFKDSGFSVFKSALDEGGVVKAMKLEGKTMSRSEIDDVTEIAKSLGAKGLAYIIYEQDGPRSPILKFFNESEMKALEEKLNPKVGDMIFFGAGEYKLVTKVLGAVRLAIRDKCKLADNNELAFCWITDFPMYQMDDDGKLDFEHNPFSMPHGGLQGLKNPNPLDIYGMQYDVSCNGYEILSGSIRNHDPETLIKAFELVGKGEKEVKEKFGAIYNAFQYGAPPHGGFAIGVDRFLMILKNEENIREIYAFPKSGKAEDTMMNAPSFVDDAQLKELHIDLREEVKEELGR